MQQGGFLERRGVSQNDNDDDGVGVGLRVMYKHLVTILKAVS